MSLRNDLKKLANAKPELRAHILPLLRREAQVSLREWKPQLQMNTLFTFNHNRDIRLEYISGTGWVLDLPMHTTVHLRSKYLTRSGTMAAQGEAIAVIQREAPELLE